MKTLIRLHLRQRSDLGQYCLQYRLPTVNSEIFAWVYFRENKALTKMANHALVENTQVANMSFNAIRENRIITVFSNYIISI